MSEPSKPPAPGVFSIVLPYAGFAALWTLLSDGAMGLFFSDPAVLVGAGMLKSWLFVLVTTLVLYVLVRRFVGSLLLAQQRELDFERERNQQPQMLAAIAEASVDAIFAKDDAGRYLLFNKAAAEFVGKPADKVIGLDDRSLFSPEQAEHLMAVDRRVRSTGKSEINEVILQTPAGERIFLSTKGPLRGADGKVYGSYGISRDVTLRKREEQALRVLADDLETTLQAVPDLLFELDVEGRFLAARASNKSVLPVPVHMWLGRTVRDMMPPTPAATVMEALAAASRNGTDYGRTIMLALESGTRHLELSVACKSVTPGHADRFIVLSRDITDRMSGEAELRRRNEELERFNRSATDRELRMVALKREVNDLARAAGQPAPYDIGFADTPDLQAGA